jgi:hypothetical protein
MQVTVDAMIALPFGDKFQGIVTGTLTKGKLIYADGSTFDGTFHNNGQRKEGLFIEPNGNMFHGLFHDNGKRKEGQSNYCEFDGIRFVRWSFDGTFDENGKRKEGLFTDSDGSTFNGTFDKNGEFKQGIITKTNDAPFC